MAGRPRKAEGNVIEAEVAMHPTADFQQKVEEGQIGTAAVVTSVPQTPIQINIPSSSESEEKKRARVTQILMQPTRASEIKTRIGGRGKQLKYVSGETAVRRLIEATNNNFSDREVWHEWTTSLVKGEEVKTLLVLVELTVPGLGSRVGMGVQIIQGGEDMYKGAYTDGFKKALTKFGGYLDLQNPDYEGEADPEPEESLAVRLGKALKASGIRTKGEANDAAQEKFGKDFGELTDEDRQSWLTAIAAVPNF